MDLAALVVALVGALMAVLSLVWQALSWRMDGARPRAEFLVGVGGGGGVAHGRPDRAGRAPDFEVMRDQGWDGPELVGVHVTNHGRARVKVSAITLRAVGGNFSVNFHGFHASPSLPHWVEGGESETWWVARAEADALLSITPGASRVRFEVTTGTGGKVQTAGSLRRRYRPAAV